MKKPIAWENTEEEFVDNERWNVNIAGGLSFGRRNRDIFEGGGLLELRAEDVAVSFGKKDTMFGVEDSPSHAMSKNLRGKLCKARCAEPRVLPLDHTCKQCRGLALGRENFGHA